MHQMTFVDWIKAIGTIVGVIAALPALFERGRKYWKLYLQRTRIKRSVADGTVALLRPANPAYSTFLLRDEIVVILLTALLVNFVCLCLTRYLQSILYLDMTGTAIAALLLGPWYGAIAGLLSSGLVNWIVGSTPYGDASIVPWAMVNMCGGLLWGYFGRSKYFARFMAEETSNVGSQIYHVLKFGVIGAGLMAIPGAAVLGALNVLKAIPGSPLKEALDQSLDHQVATALDTLLSGSISGIATFFAQFVHSATVANSLAQYLVLWLQSTAKYIPDKTFSIVIAIIAIKAAFPLYEKQLIHARANALPSRPRSREGLIFLALLVPYTLVLVLTPHFRSHSYWQLWVAPLVVGSLVLLIESLLPRPIDVHGTEVRRRKEERRVRYEGAKALLPRDHVARPGLNLILASMATNLLFVLVMPLLLPDTYFQVAFKFLCLVYGFQVAMYLYSVAIGQNLAVRAAEEPPQQERAKAG